MYNWLENNKIRNTREQYNEVLQHEVNGWLGEKSPQKEKLVRLLIARLKWDWKTLEELSQNSMEEISRQGEDMGLEYQICRMDICHFAFPVHLINIMQGIGKMHPVLRFEGCGTFNSNIKRSILSALNIINRWLLSMNETGKADHNMEELTRIWLFACLAKTIKEQVGLNTPIPLPAIS